MAKNRPYFTLQVNVTGCRYDIRVNDVPIAVDRRGTKVIVEMPLNPYVFTGKNVLRCNLMPLEGEVSYDSRARCEATVYTRPAHSARESRTLVGGLIFSGSDLEGGNGFRSSPAYETNPPSVSRLRGTTIQAERAIELLTPFPRWEWLDAFVIRDQAAARADLVRIYQQFWQLLQDKNAPQVESLTELKARELMLAYNLENMETSRDRIEFERFMADPNLRLQPFSPEKPQLEVFGDGKLARLVDKDGDSPIVFVNADRSLAFFMNMMYCRTGSRGWVQVR